MSTIKVNKFEGAIFDGGVGEEKGRVGIVVLATDQTLGRIIELQIGTCLDSVFHCKSKHCLLLYQ